MPCQCNQVDSAEIVGEINPQGLIEFRHTGCGAKFSRQVILCRCDTVKGARPPRGSIHFKGCPIWVALRTQAVRDRLDGKPKESEEWGPLDAKYLGSTKRGKRFRVKP